MIERVFITIALIALGVVLCRVFNAWHLRRARTTASMDPLLVNYSQGLPGVLLFTADFCAPCKTVQQPAIRRLVEQVGEGNIQVFMVNVEKNPDMAQRWGVMSLPTTFILDRNGSPRDVNHGVTSTEKLKRQLEAIG
jgi:thioredoxin-like negative regulator of GroEL